jgi:hypothetical protein
LGARYTTRRRLLAASGTALLSSVAGCSAVGELVGEALLAEVNIFNETDQQVDGTVGITGPAGATVLDETFELVPSEASAADDDEKNAAATYDDVWTDPGGYEVSIELTNTDIEGTTRADETVDIEDTQAEMLGVTLGPGAGDESILLRAGEEPAEISDPADVADSDG